MAKTSEEIRKQQEENLELNLGANWRDIYDLDSKSYINGYSADNLTDGRIGVSLSTGYDMGDNGDGTDDKYTGRTESTGGYRPSTGGSVTDSYYRLQQELLEDIYNSGKEELEAFSANAAREAYVAMMESSKDLSQQVAALGGGGVSETSALALQSQYLSSLSDIDTATSEGLRELEQSYNQGLMDSAIESAKAYEERRLQAEEASQQYKSDIGKIVATSAVKEGITPSALKTISELGGYNTTGKTITVSKKSPDLPSYTLLEDTEENNRLLKGLS